MLLATVLAAVFAAVNVEVVETGPSGSALDLAEVADAIDVLPEMFDAAESTIDLSQMYLLHYPPQSKGRLLHRLYDGLVRAAGRGVRVRVLLDSLTLEQNQNQTYQRMRAVLSECRNVEVRSCDLRRFSRYPACMLHAKYCVVDRRAALVGSHNWSFGAFADNRELSLLVRDAAFCRRLAAVFDTDWLAAAGARASPGLPPERGAVRLVVTSPESLPLSGVLSTIDALGQTVNQADSALVVEVNSFTTRVDFGPAERFEAVESLLEAAARRGVRVRLLVDKWAEEQEPELFRHLDSIAGIEVRIADISALGPNPGAGTVHAKLVVADGEVALVGSATFSQRQLLECRNVGVLVRDRQVAGRLLAVFERDWSSGFTRRP